MFKFIKSENFSTPSEGADYLEKYVYERLKPLGFRRFGRTLHRFVDGDISQVIDFQLGTPAKGYGGKMWINTGIRIPECDSISGGEQKKYYREYECQIRSRLGSVSGKRELCIEVKQADEAVAKRIMRELERVVLPAFDALCSREKILKFRRDYPLMDIMSSHLIDLDEAFIYRRLGDTEKARAGFRKHYDDSVRKYEMLKEKGEKIFLKKGQRAVVGTEDVTAERSGFYTFHTDNDAYVKHLEQLGAELGLM